jgi:hypothetical protein
LKYEQVVLLNDEEFHRLTGITKDVFAKCFAILKESDAAKKKRHTLKAQVVVDKESQKVICTAFSNGKKHDFHLFNLHEFRRKSKMCPNGIFYESAPG